MTSKPVVLIVDDEPIVIELLSETLQNDYTVFGAFDATQALEILKAQPVTLVIVDVILPGMDGFELCAHIKADTRLCHIPVILLTAKSDLQDKIAGLKFGADVYIEKPFSPAFVEAQVASLLKNRSRLKTFLTEFPLADMERLSTESDEKFLTRLRGLIEEYLSDPLLDASFLASQFHMSRSSFYRKVKLISDLTPYEIIELVRLQRSVVLFQEGHYKMNEIATITGFSSASQFTKSFKRKFGKAPLQYFKSGKEKNIQALRS